MKLHLILLIIAMVCSVRSLLHRNSGSRTDEQQCEATCKDCFANRQDSLKRMGCLEKCIRQDVNQFTCPGSNSFLGVVDTLSPVIQTEIEDLFQKRSEMLSVKDVVGYIVTLSENALGIIDGQKPVIGRADRTQQLRDYFTANPELDHMHFDLVNFGDEYGIIWVNGVIKWFDKQDRQVSFVRFMSLFKRINGELQEFTMALFQ
ncbi:uncharacterized protein [Amphiura filiformis]|uniref:uncharacterized protein n=1 Tax=Amphiura filiformis TaxID=82378 RepID=UPI003B20DABD